MIKSTTGYSSEQAYTLKGHANLDCHLDKLIRDNAFEPKILRRCLNCDVVFVATGKFNRTCHKCKESKEYED